MKLIGQCNVYQYTNITDISADVANSSTNINASIILVGVMYFTDVPMLKIWPILANTNTDINIGASLILARNAKGVYSIYDPLKIHGLALLIISY